MPAPVYVVFAGVNGAGKSTFYQSGLWRTPWMPRRMARINPDEILREGGMPQPDAAENHAPGPSEASSSPSGPCEAARSPFGPISAGKLALRRMGELFAMRRSFNHETTLSGHIAVRNVKRAHELGYIVVMYYIGVASADVAVERVAHRAGLGGHDIPPEIVRKRCRTSLSNFAKCLDYCDQAYVFDNTVGFTCLAGWQRGTLSWWGSGAGQTNWLADAIVDEKLWRRA